MHVQCLIHLGSLMIYALCQCGSRLRRGKEGVEFATSVLLNIDLVSRVVKIVF